MPMLVLLRNNLRKVGLDPGDESIWKVVFTVKLLTMVNGIPCSKAIDLFLCNLFKRTTTQVLIKF